MNKEGLRLLKSKYKKTLWGELKTDREKYEFLICGRANDTGIIALSMVREVSMAFLYRHVNNNIKS